MSTFFSLPSGWGTSIDGLKSFVWAASKRKPYWSHSAATLRVNVLRLFDHQKPAPSLPSKESDPPLIEAPLDKLRIAPEWTVSVCPPEIVAPAPTPEIFSELTVVLPVIEALNVAVALLKLLLPLASVRYSEAIKGRMWPASMVAKSVPVPLDEESATAQGRMLMVELPAAPPPPTRRPSSAFSRRGTPRRRAGPT